MNRPRCHGEARIRGAQARGRFSAIVAENAARQPRPFDRVLAFLDPAFLIWLASDEVVAFRVQEALKGTKVPKGAKKGSKGA